MNDLNLLQNSSADVRARPSGDSYTDSMQHKPSIHLRVSAQLSLLSLEENTSFLPYNLSASQGDF